ncbi:hypothetical protein JTE90_003643 [Oedothorax gibbosus]|uniref:Ionotropic glutamate receptor L-glutamate and glycine-binding domain-containing protein n=1 Tax=Oedothorax gibbosus TaxID=931172 RepID=A0AAV6U5S0_9ARAC|nr:hypothetical protein JTE90_003643 [Oedothorax gibbosus]
MQSRNLPKLVVAVIAMKYMMELKTNNQSRLELSNTGEARYLKELISALGFDYEVRQPKDGEYGRLMKNGTWTGLFGMIQRNEVDLVCAGLMMTDKRAGLADFTTPYSGTPLTFAIGKAGEKTPTTDAFLDPFQNKVWFACLGTMFAVAFIVRLEGRHSFLRILFELGGSVLRQRIAIIDGSSMKMLLVLWSAYALLLSSTYSSMLLSFMTIPNQGKNVETFEQLAKAVKAGTHKCSVQRGTNTATYMIATETEHIQYLGKEIESNDWYYNTEDMGKHKTLDYFSAEITYASELRFFYSGPGSQAFISRDTFSDVIIAMAVKKGFCCMEKLNSIIARFNAAGLYEKFVDDASFLYHLDYMKTSKPKKDEKKQLSFDRVKGSLVLLLVGYLASIIVFLGEIFMFKCRVWTRIDVFKTSKIVPVLFTGSLL